MQYVAIVSVLVGSIAVYLEIRNELVYRMRSKMIAKVFEFDDWYNRVKFLNQVSYDYMVFSCKWPIAPETFYPDTSFLHE